MAAVEMRADLSQLIDALTSNDDEAIVKAASAHLQQGEAADVLIGRVGLIAAQGDADGHIVTTLTAAAMLARYLHFIPQPLSPDTAENAQAHRPLYALPLFLQALRIAAPAVRTGHTASIQYPDPLFPSELIDTGKTVQSMMSEAISGNDVQLAERVLLGLYGTGADYRTMQVRAYDSIASTFQDAGHPLIFAVRGFQLLDAVEWGDRAPSIIHWLAPHLPLRPEATQPSWVQAVQTFVADPAHDVSGIRTRLAIPKDERALPLRQLILSSADTLQVCQGVYQALVQEGASPRAISSVIALAAAEIIQSVNVDQATFTQTAHGLLFASAIRLVFRQVQDVDVLALLFTSAAYINALYKEVDASQKTERRLAYKAAGGGLIEVSQLEALRTQLQAQDFDGAFATAQRYLQLKHDPRALFGAIGLAVAEASTTQDQGHTLQIAQAASEEYLAWPASLRDVNIDVFLQVALRAAKINQ